MADRSTGVRTFRAALPAVTAGSDPGRRGYTCMLTLIAGASQCAWR
jgi:UPF0716 family protein affecting phage T7 exclusion